VGDVGAVESEEAEATDRCADVFRSGGLADPLGAIDADCWEPDEEFSEFAVGNSRRPVVGPEDRIICVKTRSDCLRELARGDDHQRQCEESLLGCGGERFEAASVHLKQLGDCCCRHVSGSYPDHLWRCPVEEGVLAEVVNLGNDDVPALRGEVPNVLVGRGIEAALDNVRAVRDIGVQRSDATTRRFLVEEQLQVEVASRRSRRAANSSAART